jgi:hypothetical protein
MSSKRRQETIAQFSVPLDDVATAGNDTFTMNTSDDEFLGNEDDDYGRGNGKKTSRSKSKGKGKACTNPKVMLLSLKAVCFSFSQVYLSLKTEATLQGAVGLNLTGMNTLDFFFKLYSFSNSCK